MSRSRSAGSLKIKTTIISTKPVERGERLRQFADRLLAQLDPEHHLGCVYNAQTNQLICSKK